MVEPSLLRGVEDEGIDRIGTSAVDGEGREISAVLYSDESLFMLGSESGLWGSWAASRTVAGTEAARSGTVIGSLDKAEVCPLDLRMP